MALKDINRRIRLGEVRHTTGMVAERPLSGALASSCGRFLYPVEDDIYVLMADLAIDTEADGNCGRPTARATHSDVRTFYEEIGWQQESDVYADAALFEDLRAVSEPYRHHCNRRVNDHLPRRGKYLVDAASGPIQYQDYLDFSEDFDVRVCVDFSPRALREAKRKLGAAALCILADVTNLPLKDGCADAAISLHTIYHVPRDQQGAAIRELHRVLRPDGIGIVVSSWGASFPVRVVQLPLTMRNMLRRLKNEVRPDMPNLYFAPFSYRWLSSQEWPFQYDVVTWRSLSIPALRAYFPDSPFGTRMLQGVALVEDRFPRLCGRWGQYPLIVIRGARSRSRP
ncbi:MAG: class I SAM-dependent methyltransferase [Acidimicrobiales bacterium]